MYICNPVLNSHSVPFISHPRYLWCSVHSYPIPSSCERRELLTDSVDRLDILFCVHYSLITCIMLKIFVFINRNVYRVFFVKPFIYDFSIQKFEKVFKILIVVAAISIASDSVSSECCWLKNILVAYVASSMDFGNFELEPEKYFFFYNAGLDGIPDMIPFYSNFSLNGTE